MYLCSHHVVLTIFCRHLDTLSAREKTNTFLAPRPAIIHVEFPRVVKCILTLWLTVIYRGADKTADCIHCNMKKTSFIIDQLLVETPLGYWYGKQRIPLWIALWNSNCWRERWRFGSQADFTWNFLISWQRTAPVSNQTITCSAYRSRCVVAIPLQTRVVTMATQADVPRPLP